MKLDDTQSSAAAQFDRQSDRYGKSHILADTRDVEQALSWAGPIRPGRALDVATGGGHTALCLARLGWTVTIGDIAPRMIDNATKLCQEAGYAVASKLFPAEEIPFADASFDLVSSRVAPHHFSDPGKFVRETSRALKPGGLFLLIDGSVPDDDPVTEEWLHHVEKWRDPSHGRLLSRKSWEALATAAGLSVVRSELHPFKQPDLQWYFETANTSLENREKVLREVRNAPPQVRQSLGLTEEDGKIVWWWPRLSLLARKAKS